MYVCVRVRVLFSRLEDHRPSYSPPYLSGSVAHRPTTFSNHLRAAPVAVPSIENAITQLAAPPASLISEDAVAGDSLGYSRRALCTLACACTEECNCIDDNDKIVDNLVLM